MPDPTRQPDDTLIKAAWRTRLTARRDALTDAQREMGSEAIRRRVLDSGFVGDGAVVMAYASVGSEVRTYTLIEALLAMDVRVALPVIGDDHAMTAVAISSLKELSPDAFGVLAPHQGLRQSEHTVPRPGVVLVPALGFDERTGHRLGRGAGYYDRYLAERPDTLAVGLAFDEQVVAGLPAEPHDVPVRMVLTPTRTLRFG